MAKLSDRQKKNILAKWHTGEYSKTDLAKLYKVDESMVRKMLRDNLGIETKTKELQVFAGGAKKGDWDVGLAVDAMKMAPKLDAVVLVAGDGDFVPLVEYLQSTSGVQVEVVSFGKSASMKLKEQADDFLDLSENYRKYLIY
jgi:uncharacterized LabA/DUF88 family protein